MPHGFRQDLLNGAAQAGMMTATPEMKLTHPYWLSYFAVEETG